MSTPLGGTTQQPALEPLLPEPVSTPKSKAELLESAWKTTKKSSTTLAIGRLILDAAGWNRPLLPEGQDHHELDAAALAGFLFSPFLTVMVYWSEKIVPKKWENPWIWGPFAFVFGTVFPAVSGAMLHPRFREVEVRNLVPEYLVGTPIVLVGVLVIAILFAICG
ncbi:hypothetical protein DL96DRAFT_1821011 [Flagelloscypha sp. PMI_526]|nr:hypothetical protein DL96DRAFT_1821011 [Flagelloscypha sp. PMI_526]